MVASLVALAVTLALGGRRLAAPRPDADVVLQATIQAIETARGAVEAYRDSTGSLPVSLDDVGLGELPLAYTRSATTFRIAALSPQGDSVGYQSPAGADGLGDDGAPRHHADRAGDRAVGDRDPRHDRCVEGTGLA
jgi:hypothetical protein